MTVEAGIVAVLDALPGDLRAAAGWPDSVHPDVAIVDGPVTLEDADMAGRDVNALYEITLLFALNAGMEYARDRLMPYLTKGDSKEIRLALYAAPTLNGNVQCFFWRGVTQPPGRILISGKGLGAEVPVSEYYGAVLQIEVIA